MQSRDSCYIVVFCINQLVTEAKHCIRQTVLQAGPNAILYSYIAVCWLSIRLQYKDNFGCFKVLIY